MSISTNIDGSTGGGGQLLDFISLVTNPQIYEAKIKSLQAATAENQKFVELIGPATEILALRDKLTADTTAAAAALAEAKVTSVETVKKAQEKAEGIVKDADAKAAKLVSEAQAAADDAKAAQAEARKSAADVKKAKVDYEALSASLSAQQAQLATTQADADKVKKEAETIRANLIAKHTEFIKSL
jgi:hypothetical protein